MRNVLRRMQHQFSDFFQFLVSISHRIGKKPINGVDNRKIFVKPTRKELAHRILCATYELNPPFYINYYLIHTKSKIDYII